MLVSDDAALIAKARKLATQARDPAPHYEHSEIGYNYRLSNVLAAIGRGQLRVLATAWPPPPQLRLLRARAGRHPGVELMPRRRGARTAAGSPASPSIPRPFGADREALRLAFEAEDIEARPVWKPMHLQPIFASHDCVGGEVAADLFERGLCLPSGSNLETSDLERVCEVVHRVSKNPPAF
jgi:pyridoxal phosphate-dependent aminotransferase EpsN